jgi:hypothetical protein
MDTLAKHLDKYNDEQIAHLIALLEEKPAVPNALVDMLRSELDRRWRAILINFGYRVDSSVHHPLNDTYDEYEFDPTVCLDSEGDEIPF